MDWKLLLIGAVMTGGGRLPRLALSPVQIQHARPVRAAPWRLRCSCCMTGVLAVGDQLHVEGLSFALERSRPTYRTTIRETAMATAA